MGLSSRPPSRAALIYLVVGLLGVWLTPLSLFAAGSAVTAYLLASLAGSLLVAGTAVWLLRSADTLPASEERFRALVENGFEGINVLAPDGSVKYSSPVNPSLLGFLPDEIAGRNALSFAHPDDLPAVQAAFAAVQQKPGCVVSFACRVQHKQQGWCHIEGYARNLLDTPAVGGIVVNWRNVTDRLLAQESLRASEQRYRDLIELAPEGIAILESGRFAFVNQAGLQLIGAASPDDLLGKPLADFLHPDDLAASRERQMEVIHKGQRVPLRPFRLRRFDGAWRFLESCAGPCRLDGKPAVLLVARDVTARVAAEQGLRESEARLRTMFEIASVGIMQTDARTGQLLLVNDRMCQITGYTREELLTRTTADLTHVEERDAAWCLYQRAVRGELPQYLNEQRCPRKDGSFAWVRVNASFIRDEGGQAVLTMSVVEDVTARRQAEDAFRQAQKMESVGLLAGGVAHDFNNLLTVINAYSDLLLKTAPGDEASREPLTQIRNAGEQGARLTQQLLAFGRKSVVMPRLVDLSELTAGSVKMLRRMVGEDVTVLTTLEQGLAQVWIDRGQIEQVLMNLVVNARDAMPRGGQLTLETRTLRSDDPARPAGLDPGPAVLLVVSDTGTGMSEEIRSRIFEPFFTTKGIGSGTGLGLAVVHGVVNQAGGVIDVASEVGKGTTFRLVFPAVPPVPAAEESPLQLAPRGKETILLVEDEDVVRTVTRIALSTQGYKVLTASSGGDALQLAEEHSGPIDLLVTDVVMPGMGGRDLADALRAARPALQVLYMSGYADDAILRHGVEAGKDAFLQKPYSALDLAQRVRAMLDSPA